MFSFLPPKNAANTAVSDQKLAVTITDAPSFPLKLVPNTYGSVNDIYQFNVDQAEKYLSAMFNGEHLKTAQGIFNDALKMIRLNSENGLKRSLNNFDDFIISNSRFLNNNQKIFLLACKCHALGYAFYLRNSVRSVGCLINNINQQVSEVAPREVPVVATHNRVQTVGYEAANGVAVDSKKDVTKKLSVAQVWEALKIPHCKVGVINTYEQLTDIYGDKDANTIAVKTGIAQLKPAANTTANTATTATAANSPASTAAGTPATEKRYVK